MGDRARRTETVGGGARTVDMEEHELEMDGYEQNGRSERQERKRRRVEDDPADEQADDNDEVDRHVYEIQGRQLNYEKYGIRMKMNELQNDLDDVSAREAAWRRRRPQPLAKVSSAGPIKKLPLVANRQVMTPTALPVSSKPTKSRTLGHATPQAPPVAPTPAQTIDLTKDDDDEVSSTDISLPIITPTVEPISVQELPPKCNTIKKQNLDDDPYKGGDGGAEGKKGKKKGNSKPARPTLLDLLKEPFELPYISSVKPGEELKESIVTNGGFAIRSLVMQACLEPSPQYSLDPSEFQATGWTGLVERERRCFRWMAHAVYDQAGGPNLQAVLALEQAWNHHLDVVEGEPITEFDQITELQCRKIRASDPTTLLWVIKRSIETAALKKARKLEGSEQDLVGKHWFGDNQIKDIKGAMCYTAPAIYYFEDGTCKPCIKKMTPNKSNIRMAWAKYLVKRVVNEDIRHFRSLNLPCGLRALHQVNPFKVDSVTSQGACFNCASAKTCKASTINSLASRILTGTRQSIVDITATEAEADRRRRARATVDYYAAVSGQLDSYNAQEVDEATANMVEDGYEEALLRMLGSQEVSSQEVGVEEDSREDVPVTRAVTRRGGGSRQTKGQAAR